MSIKIRMNGKYKLIGKEFESNNKSIALNVLNVSHNTKK